MTRRLFPVLCLLGIVLLNPYEGPAQDRYTAEGRDRWTQPLELEEMYGYSSIPFRPEDFGRIRAGMTEEAVLEILGRPLDLQKVKRPKNRWTVTYLYADGYAVNFKNGLVVGKEKR